MRLLSSLTSPSSKRALLSPLGYPWTLTTGVSSKRAEFSVSRQVYAAQKKRAIPRDTPEPLPKAAPELWTALNHPHYQPSSTQEEEYDKELFSHPMYSPEASPDVSLGPLQRPLHFPEWDQRVPSMQASGLASPPTWTDIPYDSPATRDSPIGPYPRLERQWTALRDPFKYWDQQGRRSYGEVLYDHDNFSDQWSPGPVEHYGGALLGTAKTFGLIGFLSFLVYLWDPESKLWFAEKEYPFEGLRKELGGDPQDSKDNWMAAKHQ